MDRRIRSHATSLAPSHRAAAVAGLQLLATLPSCTFWFGIEETAIQDAAVDATNLEDEDLDGHFNDTDNCPGIANDPQADRDADGVGDACDEHPDQPVDRIVARFYFSQPDVDRVSFEPPAGWEFRQGELTSSRTTCQRRSSRS